MWDQTWVTTWTNGDLTQTPHWWKSNTRKGLTLWLSWTMLAWLGWGWGSTHRPAPTNYSPHPPYTQGGTEMKFLGGKTEAVGRVRWVHNLSTTPAPYRGLLPPPALLCCIAALTTKIRGCECRFQISRLANSHWPLHSLPIHRYTFMAAARDICAPWCDPDEGGRGAGLGWEWLCGTWTASGHPRAQTKRRKVWAGVPGPSSQPLAQCSRRAGCELWMGSVLLW